jgi:acyl carrier protein
VSDDISERVLAFLRATVAADLTLDSELLESGLMDSFKAVTVIAFIESEFELRVDPSDITSVDLTSPRAISQFVESLKKRPPEP